MTLRRRDSSIGLVVMLLALTGCNESIDIAQMQLAVVDRLDSMDIIPAPQATAPVTEFRPAPRAACCCCQPPRRKDPDDPAFQP